MSDKYDVVLWVPQGDGTIKEIAYEAAEVMTRDGYIRIIVNDKEYIYGNVPFRMEKV